MDADMKSCYIARHDEAARLTLSAIIKGGSGNRIVYTNMGSAEKVKHLQTGDKAVGLDIILNRVLTEHDFAIY